jgi:hypothetical protein
MKLSKDVIVIGNSKKIINILYEIYHNSEITVFNWRKKNNLNKKLNYNNLDIYLCGFDYESVKYDYKKFININVKNQINFLKKFLIFSPRIFYINTEKNKKNYTYSRYKFAKSMLNYEIYKISKKLKTINVPVICVDNKPQIYGSKIISFIFCILIKINFIKKISTESLKKKILTLINTDIYKAPKKIIGKNIKYPRTLFVDRMLRLLYG